MVRPIDLLEQDRKDELWEMCCGFIDLPLEEFMKIQKRLLLEQIELLKNSELGRKVMRHAMPNSIDDFRRTVPLTTYADYCPELPQKQEKALPAKPIHWIRTSGYSGTYETKWVPISEQFAREGEKVCAACAMFALSGERHDIASVREHWKVLYSLGSLEYGSGMIGHLTQQAFNFDFLPSQTNGLSFTDKIREGFAQALYEGLDAFGGLPSVLVTVGEQIKEQSRKPEMSFLRAHPTAALRLVKGMVKSKLARRAMLPRDLWHIKAILGSGTDSAVYGKKVEEMWGRRPLELYSGTEGLIYATQTWDREGGMTFIPTLNFFEFIPEAEYLRGQENKEYRPRTVLLDEVQPESNYELVITNLHGGCLVRFRIGDVIRVASLKNIRSGVNLPQMVFWGRADYLIDIAGLGRLTERIIWDAIENTGIPYVEWTARKEIKGDRSFLHIFIEPRHRDRLTGELMATAITRELSRLEAKYHHNPYNIYDGAEVTSALERTLDSGLVEVSLLPQGAFAGFIARRQAEGADLGHLKPPHINPSEKVISLLSSGATTSVPVAETVAVAG